MKSLLELLDELERITPNFEKENKTISSSEIGWHIAHTTIVIKKIIEQLDLSDPSTYKWSFSKTRAIVFLIKKIPRGRAKSPKTVDVQKGIAEKDLIKYIDGARQSINLLSQMNQNKNFQHPYFGILNVKATKKFLKIHTNHHLKIINDILKA